MKRLKCIPTLLKKDIGDEDNPYFSLWAVCLVKGNVWECPRDLKDDDVVLIFREWSYTYGTKTGREYSDSCLWHNDILEHGIEGASV